MAMQRAGGGFDEFDWYGAMGGASGIINAGSSSGTNQGDSTGSIDAEKARRKKEREEARKKWEATHNPDGTKKDADPDKGDPLGNDDGGEYGDHGDWGEPKSDWSAGDVAKWIAKFGADLFTGNWIGGAEKLYDVASKWNIPWDQISDVLGGAGLSPDDLVRARNEFEHYRRDSDNRMGDRGTGGHNAGDPNNDAGGGPGGGNSGGGNGGGGGGGGDDYNFDFTSNFDPADPSTWPTGMGAGQDHDWSQSLAEYGPKFRPTGSSNPFEGDGGGMGQGGGFPFGDSYYGTPGGGDPHYNNRRPDYEMDPDLQRLARKSGQGPNSAIDFTRNPFSQQYGYNGVMTPYDTTDDYNATVNQIDQQTAEEIAQQKEDFGADGMRWSSPLLAAMGKTRQRAAGDKNKLLLDMKRDESQKAWERQMAEAGKKYEDYMGQTGLDWDIAKTKGGMQNDRADRTFQNVLGLDDRGFDRSKYYDERDYGRWNDEYGKKNDMEQRSYDRWKYADDAGYGRSRDASEMAMRLGQMEDDRDRQMMLDDYNLGGQDEDRENADLGAQYGEWKRAYGQQDDTMQQLMQFITGAGGGPMMKEDKGFWDKYGKTIGDLIKSYSASGD